MAKKPAVPSRDPDEQVRIRLTNEVRLEEFGPHAVYPAGSEATFSAAILADPRLAGKFEEL